MKHNILLEKHFCASEHLIKASVQNDFSFEEFLLLLYLEDATEKILEVEKIKKYTCLNEEQILNAFHSLLKRKWITLTTTKDECGKIKEIVSLDLFYQNILEEKQEEEKEESKVDIYASFETEFGRPISSMEYEIINAWIEKGFTEELILGALKEAVYNGVTNLRYIDKILYEWQKKGYKTMKEVKEGLVKREETKTTPLFDYNWLEENDE